MVARLLKRSTTYPVCLACFLCVVWRHLLWDPIDTPVWYNWVANQNVGFQSHDNKSKEDGGHFIVWCDTMMISISCYLVYPWQIVITTRKWSLGQGNVFASVCHSFCPWGVDFPACITGHMARGSASMGGSPSRGLCLQDGGGQSWTVPKYRSNSVYTSSYKRHRTVQYEVSIRTIRTHTWSREQLATRHSREHTLSAVGPDAPVE